MSTEQITHLMDNSEFDAWADIYAEARISDLIQIPSLPSYVIPGPIWFMPAKTLLWTA